VTKPIWIDIDTSSGTNNGSFTLTTRLNTFDTRSGFVTVTAGDTILSFVVVQASMPTPEQITGTFRYAGYFDDSRDFEAPFGYDDNFFLQSSKVYNPQLALMSLSLQMATFPSHEIDPCNNASDHWVDRTKNGRELLTGEVFIAHDIYDKQGIGLGFDQFHQNNYWSDPPTEDSIGVVAANKIIADINNDNKEYRLIALSIRGSGYRKEWANNFTIGSSGRHHGFAESSEKVLEFLEEYIEYFEITGDIKLWIVGYSRGGGVANLVGAALNEGHVIPNVTLAQRDLFVYTFANPQGGQVSNLAGSINHSNMHSIINLSDIVPMVAPRDWGFTPYGAIHLLPSTLTTTNFDDQLSRMVMHFASLGGHNDNRYVVEELTIKQNLRIDRNNWNQFGQPLYWWEESVVKRNDILRDSVSFLALEVFTNDMLDNRQFYSAFLQDGVREIFSVLNVDDNKMNDFADEFLGRLLTLSELFNILLPLFDSSPNTSFESRMIRIADRLDDFVRINANEIANDLGLDVSESFINALAFVVRNSINEVAYEVWHNNNTDTINLLNKLYTYVNSGTIKQAHIPETYLAWLMNLSIDDQPLPLWTRAIHIKCPVDVTVYDSNNTIVASIINNVPQDVGGSIISLINNNGEIVLYLPPDEDYRIVINATDDGEMTFSISEHCLLENRALRLVNYYNVPISTGDTFTGIVSSFSAFEIENGIPDGSTAEYVLLNSSSTEIPGRVEILGADVENNYFTVSVNTNNDSGFANGAGTFLRGRSAKLTATPLSGSDFLGWHIGDTLVSMDYEYQFAVIEDIEITAKFTHVDRHKLNLISGTGGRITSVEGHDTTGTRVQVVAEADNGYSFVGWTTTQGTFEEATSEDTWFIMPDSEASVTAVFASSSSFIVTFVNWDGTVLNMQAISHGEAATSPAEPVREGFIFLGWDTDFGNVTSNLTVTAQFRADSIDLINVTPSAYVERVPGNRNNLTITITEFFSDGSTSETAETFSIENNSSGYFDVGIYRVFVSTRGNTQIREIYIVE